METTTRHTGDLALDVKHVRTILTEFLRDETRNPGFSKAIIGLSGGVDSAVSAILAAEALGPENVYAVMMPYRTSSPQSLSDAQRVAARTGIHTEKIEITGPVDAYLAAAGVMTPLRAGNVMARQRMIVLYDVSSRENGLVVGTSNKTELLLGYGTLFGDMACAVNPLGDLYKSQIWQLAEAIGVPKEIIAKKPSADLWEGQTDEDEFGFSYAEADRLLYYMIDERRTDAELLGLGFDGGFVTTLRKKIMRTQFKRRLPLIAKISHRTVNVDFRYPRDWGI